MFQKIEFITSYFYNYYFVETFSSDFKSLNCGYLFDLTIWQCVKFFSSRRIELVYIEIL